MIMIITVIKSVHKLRNMVYNNYYSQTVFYFLSKNLTLHDENKVNATSYEVQTYDSVQPCTIWLFVVYEKEREWGHDPEAPEDTPFGEYTRK